MDTYRALRITEQADSTFAREITAVPFDTLPAGEVMVQVKYSSLNYKDALSATGNRGVTRQYPHTPGIDAAGIVVHSDTPLWQAGDEVIVTSYDLGMNTPGGLAEYIRVPADWVVALPANLSLRESMILGTAGFTAALSLYKMERAGQHPEMGEVVVTGASGGVGSLAVGILAQAGYEVVASTGSAGAKDFLLGLGAHRIEDRAYVNDSTGRPLLRPQWAGAVDTVGGETLATLLKGCHREGSVAACGLVGSPKLPTTVFPFILNGVNLLGIDSATIGREVRQEVWNRLAEAWLLPDLGRLATEVSLDELDPYIDQILQGKTQGRILVSI